MWQPRLEQSGRTIGRVVASSKGAGEYSVICLLDPPKHALPATSYREAQASAAELYSQIPRDEPFLVGLQEEFWTESQNRLDRVGGPALDEDYLDAGGFGIVHALSRATAQPDILRLEDAAFCSAYKDLENDAINFMQRFAPFLEALVRAFRNGAHNYSSPELGEVVGLIRKYRTEKALRPGEYRARLFEAARKAGVNLDAPAFKGLRLYERIEGLEGAVGRDDAANQAKQELAERIVATSASGRLAPRPAWELFRYSLTTRALPEEELEAELARVDAFLAEEPLPEPDEQVTASALRILRERAMKYLRVVRPREDKGEELGDYGDLASNLLELAAIVEIEPGPFEPLALYVHYADADRQLKRLARGAVGSLVEEALKRLENETLEKLAPTARDRVMVAAEPVAGFLEALGRFQILHGEEYRGVTAGFRPTQFCESLEAAGVALPPTWRAQVGVLESDFDTLRNYFDLTILRGKDMAGALFRAMKQHGVRRGVVYCDGYQHANLARWFEAREVSHSMVMPAWK